MNGLSLRITVILNLSISLRLFNGTLMNAMKMNIGRCPHPRDASSHVLCLTIHLFDLETIDSFQQGRVPFGLEIVACQQGRVPFGLETVAYQQGRAQALTPLWLSGNCRPILMRHLSHLLISSRHFTCTRSLHNALALLARRFNLTSHTNVLRSLPLV